MRAIIRAALGDAALGGALGALCLAAWGASFLIDPVSVWVMP